MNRREAQEILLRHRPGQPPLDDETRHALDLLKCDPELARWYDDQEHFAQSFRAAVQQIQPPTNLRDEILARPKIIAPPWQRRSFIVAAAAAVALLAVGLIFWLGGPREEPSFAVFESRMVSFALRQYRMDIETADEAAVRSYLQEQGTPSKFPLPPQLASLPVKGGASLTWKSRPVSMLCFDWQGKETLYLFVIEQNQVENASLPADPIPSRHETIATAAWEANNLVYVLVSGEGLQTLDAIF